MPWPQTPAGADPPKKKNLNIKRIRSPAKLQYKHDSISLFYRSNIAGLLQASCSLFLNLNLMIMDMVYHSDLFCQVSAPATPAYAYAQNKSEWQIAPRGIHYRQDSIGLNHTIRWRYITFNSFKLNMLRLRDRVKASSSTRSVTDQLAYRAVAGAAELRRRWRNPADCSLAEQPELNDESLFNI